MPYYTILIHMIWATKNRYPYLKDGIKEKVIAHILVNAKDKGIFIECINGTADHVHALIRLRPDQSLSQIAHLIKGESSRWINIKNITQKKFAWQEEYMAFSISHSGLMQVRRYIKNQERHHQKISFSEEMEIFPNIY